MRLLWVRTLILGLGFFAISTVGPLYDSYMPIFYRGFLASSFLVGLVMVIDNVLALTLQPYFGALSDQTRTRLGRRIPYFLVGAPLSALLLALVPFAREAGLASLLVTTVLLNLALVSYRSPTVALMPDLVPSHLRSQANGIINWMGALGAALAFLVGSILYRMDVRLPFMAFAGLLLLVTVVFFLWIREPEGAASRSEESGGGLAAAVAGLRRGLGDRRAAWMLLAIVLWSGAFQGANTWFTSYGKFVRGMHEADASFSLLFFAGAILLFAIPAGFLGGRGRRATMAAGAILMSLGILAVPSAAVGWPLRISLLVAGAGWSLIVVNAYPALVQMAPEGKTGTYTGLYYIAGQAGAIAFPPIFGLLIDGAGWFSLFAGAVVLLLASAWAVMRAEGSEAAPVARAAAAD